MSILCYGDSLTAGFCEGGLKFVPYSEMLPLPATAFGLSGWTAQQMRDNLETAVCRDEVGHVSPGLSVALAEDQYDVVVLLAGTNDLGGVGSSQSQMERVVDNVWALHQTCHAAGAKTICVSIPGSGWQATTPIARAACRHINELLRARVSRHRTHAKYVDFPIMYGMGPMWGADGLHLTEDGYRALGTLLGPHVERLV